MGGFPHGLTTPVGNDDRIEQRGVESEMIPYKTKSEFVFERLRQKIIDRELKPGQRIVLSDIAKEFGTSEIPIREAIRKFESEGIVKITPHVGAVVSMLEGSEYLEVYLMRIELEVLATKLAAPVATEKDIAALEKLILKADRAVQADKLEKLGPLNKEFHLRIYQIGPYPLLYKTVVDLWDRFELMQCVFSLVPKRAISSHEEHKKILSALADKNGRLAGRLVREHKNRTKKAIERAFRNKETK